MGAVRAVLASSATVAEPESSFHCVGIQCHMIRRERQKKRDAAPLHEIRPPASRRRCLLRDAPMVNRRRPCLDVLQARGEEIIVAANCNHHRMLTMAPNRNSSGGCATNLGQISCVEAFHAP
jgi:hypothetical protein